MRQERHRQWLQPTGPDRSNIREDLSCVTLGNNAALVQDDNALSIAGDEL
jgi:hypothetical protein